MYRTISANLLTKLNTFQSFYEKRSCTINKIPDSNYLLTKLRHFVGSLIDPTLINCDGPMSFCSSGPLNCQRLVRCWSNALSPTSPAYVNVMPTILFQVSRWANVGPTWFKSTSHYEFVREICFSLLCDICWNISEKHNAHRKITNLLI